MCPGATAVEASVTGLQTLIRRSTLELIEQVLGQTTPGRAARQARSGARPAAAAEPGTLTASTPGRRGKRTKEQLEVLANALLKYIGKNPGQRMEQVAMGMKMSSKELTSAIQKQGRRASEDEGAEAGDGVLREAVDDVGVPPVSGTLQIWSEDTSRNGEDRR